MPPAFLHLLRGIAEHSQVDMYVPLPTPHYFGDLRERRDRVGDNGLLARFGTESREFADTLIDLEDQVSQTWRGEATVTMVLFQVIAFEDKVYKN